MAGQLAPGYITFTGAIPGLQQSSLATVPSAVAVPDVTGLPEADATQTLQSLGFVVRPQPVQSRVGNPGSVLSQSPPAPTPSAAGTLVVIYIIQAPPASPIDVTKRFDDLEAAIVKVQADTEAAIDAARKEIRDVGSFVGTVGKGITDAISESQRAVISAIPTSVTPGNQTQTASAQKGTRG